MMVLMALVTTFMTQPVFSRIYRGGLPERSAAAVRATVTTS
jgi:hypothetical protein